MSKILYILNAFCVGGRIMEYLMFILCVCLCVVGHYTYSFISFRKNQKLIKNRLDYRKARMKEANEAYKKTGIFREIAIEEIAKQKLIYDEKSGRYIRRRQIN